MLTQGHQVIIIDDLSNGHIIAPEAKFIQQDIGDLDSIHEWFVGIDGCFHLAAIPSVTMDFSQWFRFHQTNLRGSLNVFKSAIDAGNVPVVYASSCGVYNDTNLFPLTEDQAIRPLSSYGCDKFSTELNANFLAHAYQLPSMGLRFFNVYGPHQPASSPYSGVITKFILDLLDDKPLTIFGDGNQTRDFVFVDDVVDHLIYAMSLLNITPQHFPTSRGVMDGGEPFLLNDRAPVVNICSGIPTTVNELADVLSCLCGKLAIKDYQSTRLNDAKYSYGSQVRMRAYGFHVHHELRAGLIKTIEYFKSERSLS